MQMIHILHRDHGFDIPTMEMMVPWELEMHVIWTNQHIQEKMDALENKR